MADLEVPEDYVEEMRVKHVGDFKPCPLLTVACPLFVLKTVLVGYLAARPGLQVPSVLNLSTALQLAKLYR